MADKAPSAEKAPPAKARELDSPPAAPLGAALPPKAMTFEEQRALAMEYARAKLAAMPKVRVKLGPGQHCWSTSGEFCHPGEIAEVTEKHYKAMPTMGVLVDENDKPIPADPPITPWTAPWIGPLPSTTVAIAHRRPESSVPGGAPVPLGDLPPQ